MTLEKPPSLLFSAEEVYQACRNVPGLRQRVAQLLGCPIADGCFWLPVVLTAKGPLYGEAISVVGTSGEKLPDD